MSDINYIIFDLDGTLIDSYATVVSAYKRVFEEHAPEAMPDNAFFERYRDKDLEQMFRLLAEMAQLSNEGFRAFYDQQYELESTQGTTIIKEAYETLRTAKGDGMGVIVITNKHQIIAEKVCKMLFAHDEIDIIIGRRDGIPIKPRHVIKDRLKMYGINPEKDCLKYYGDSESDRKTAELLNVKFINTKNK